MHAGYFIAPTDEPMSTTDTEVIIRRHVEAIGLAAQHIDSFNALLDHELRDVFDRTYQGISRTVVYAPKKNKSTDISTVRIEPKYTNINVEPPRYVDRETSKRLPLTPMFAQMNKRYYVAPFTADFSVSLIATKTDGTEIVRTETIKSVEITSMPIIVKSNKCPNSMMTYEMLVAAREDPLDLGGYYSLGSEWISKHIESLKYNELRIFLANHEGIAVRGEMLSKLDNTNGNSAQFIMQLMDDDEFIIKVDHKPFRNFFFPFYTLFRLLGAETHKEMMDSIVYEYESPISKYIQTRMMRCFEAKYKQFPLAAQFVTVDSLRDYVITYMDTDFNKAGRDIYEKNKDVWYADLYKYIDLYFMPHIGTAETDRKAKREALGLFMRMMWLVEMGVYPETDRDSEVSKRNERSGQRMVKMLKTYINSTIARPLLDAYEHALKNMAFEDINLKEVHNNACDSDRLKKINIKLITGGTKKAIKTGDRGKSIVNRLISHQRTGGILKTISDLREIVSDPTTASSKQSEREHRMRQVHDSSFGFKCPIQTQESENIGRNKEMTVMCDISAPSSISLLLDTLMQEYKTGLIIKSPALADRTRMTKVSINWSGIELGWTDQPYLLADKYRHMRRMGEIDKYISIVWNTFLDMVIFYCDGDRLIRPVCIVQNNYGNSFTKDQAREARGKDSPGDLSDFRQWSLVRKHHIEALRDGSLTVNDLLEQGLMEIIDAEEQYMNCIVAHSPEYLEEKTTNHMVRYTHVEIPASVYGLPVLYGNNFNLNNGTRNAYASNHHRQAAADYPLNWRYRSDKGISLQTYNEISPVRTVASTIAPSPGVVCTVAVMGDQYNQEDSQTWSSMVVESGKFTTEYLQKMTSALGNDEEFRVPDLANSNRKVFADYSTVDAATNLPAKGTLIRKGSVVIPKVHKTVNKKTGNTVFEDKSSIFPSSEPALVYNARKYRNEDDVTIHEVNMFSTRNPTIGDKFSSRHGQKGVMGAIKHPNDMPFCTDGSIPDIIINMFCQPTRMTTAQWTESVYALIYAKMCSSVDGTVHSHINMRDVPAMLESMGFHPDGTTHMFDPASGMLMKTRIFRGLVLYQNVQKNVRDKLYAVESGPTDLITRGPLEGKAAGGSLRLGEMERDVLLAIGCTLFISEKYYFHSNNETIYVCENCGVVPNVNMKYGVDCLMCGDGVQAYAIETTHASSIFLQELATINIKIRLELEDHIYYARTPTPSIAPSQDNQPTNASA
jgi:DNA-directed RNA polymerase beta subunit